jgi:hypothetical protein
MANSLESSNPVPVSTEYGAAGNSEIQMPVVSFKLVAQLRMGKKESMAAAPGAVAARAGVVMNGNAYVMNWKAKRCQKSST